MRFADDVLFVLTLLTAAPDHRSLMIGAGIAFVSFIGLSWVEAYPPQAGLIRGPFRFVRYPQRLAFWLLWLGIAIAARSFPALLVTLIFLPLFHWQDHLVGKDLLARRYHRFVPALVPTLFPFPSSDRSPSSAFSWRRAILQIKGRRLHFLCILIFGAAAVLATPLAPLWTFALAWALIRIVQLVYERRFA